MEQYVSMAIAVFGVAAAGGGWVWSMARGRQQLEESRSDIAELRHEIVEMRAATSHLDPELRPRVTNTEQKVATLEAIVETFGPRFMKIDQDHQTMAAKIDRMQTSLDRLIGAINMAEGVRINHISDT